MSDSLEIYAENRSQWRKWLAANHQTRHEVWLVFYKKKSGQPTVSYDEAVEEALCFGWIDSLMKGMDETRYKQKFTPRKAKSVWSESNKKRVKALLAKGQMTEAGLHIIEEAKKNGSWNRIPASRQVNEPPAEFVQALDNHQEAKAFFDALAPSHQKRFIGWIGSAKRKETRLKRTRESIDLLQNRQKLGLK